MPDGGWDAALAGIRERLDTDERLARAQLEASEAGQSDRHAAEVVLQRVESDRLTLAAVARYLDPYSSCDRRVAETVVANILAVRFMAPHYVEVPGFPEVLRLDQAETR